MEIQAFWLAPLTFLLGNVAQCNVVSGREWRMSSREGDPCDPAHDTCGMFDLVCQASVGTCQCKPCGDLEAMNEYWISCKACLNVQRMCNDSRLCTNTQRCSAGQRCECIAKCSQHFMIVEDKLKVGARIVLSAVAAVAMLASVVLFWHSYFRNSSCTSEGIGRERSISGQSRLDYDAGARWSLSSVQQYVLARLHCQPPSYGDTSHIHLERPPPYQQSVTSGDRVVPVAPEPPDAVRGVGNLAFAADDISTTNSSHSTARK